MKNKQLYILRYTDEYIEGIFTSREAMANYLTKVGLSDDENYFYEKVPVDPIKSTNAGKRMRILA